jgi:hypothetical protein
MQRATLIAIALAPVGAYLLSLPIRAFVRTLWRRMPDGRMKRLLFGKVRFMDAPPGWKPWDQ